MEVLAGNKIVIGRWECSEEKGWEQIIKTVDEKRYINNVSNGILSKFFCVTYEKKIYIIFLPQKKNYTGIIFIHMSIKENYFPIVKIRSGIFLL